MKMHFCLMVPLVLLITSVSAGEGPSCPDQKTVGGICYERDLNDVDTSSYGCNANCTYREMKHSDSDERFCFRNGDLPVTDVCTDPSPETFVVTMETSLTSDCKESPMVANIGYLFQGYDIYKGNPLQEDTLHFDPGLRQPIFKATYGNRCTSDHRYKIPEGTSVLDCSGCSLSFSTKQVSDMKSYKHSLSLKVSAEGGGWGAAFSASYGHKNVESKIKNSDHIFTHSEASCCSYKAQMLSYMLPTFSENFITAIENLPEAYTTDADKEKYQEIIDTFGTHYINKITMGSLFGEESEIKSEDLKTMQDKGMNINAAASYSGFDVTASAKFTDQSKTNLAHDFQQKSSHQRVYTVGPPPPEDNNMGKWAQEANKSPEPISQKLKSIINLLERQHSLNISTAVMENLNTTFNNYETYLSEQELISNKDGMWSKVIDTGVIFDIAIRDNDLYGLGEDKIYKCSLSGGFGDWSKMFNDDIDQIYHIVIKDNDLYATNKQTVLKRPLSGSGSWSKVIDAKDMTGIAIKDNDLYGVFYGKKGIWKHSLNGSEQWSNIIHSDGIISIAIKDNDVYGVDTSNKIWKHSLSGSGSWSNIINTGNMIGIAIKDNDLYGVGQDYKIWKYTI